MQPLLSNDIEDDDEDLQEEEGLKQKLPTEPLFSLKSYGFFSRLFFRPARRIVNTRKQRDLTLPDLLMIPEEDSVRELFSLSLGLVPPNLSVG